MEEVLGGPPEGRIPVIHLPVAVPASEIRCAPLHQPPVILCPAYLYELKGHRYLIEALDILQGRGVQVRLLLAGQGPLRSKLQSFAQAKGLEEAVQFLGHISHQRLLAIYAQREVDLVVLPSLIEGIPVSLMEAMGYGVPVIGTDVGGVGELLCGEAGLLVPARDPVALAEAIERVLCDEQLRRRLGQAGRRRVQEGWSPKHCVMRLVEMMQQPPGDRSAVDRPESNTSENRCACTNPQTGRKGEGF